MPCIKMKTPKYKKEIDLIAYLIEIFTNKQKVYTAEPKLSNTKKKVQHKSVNKIDEIRHKIF